MERNPVGVGGIMSFKFALDISVDIGANDNITTYEIFKYYLK